MRKSTRDRTVRTAAAAAVLETMEARTFLSATLVNGVLTVTGTGGADTIAVTFGPPTDGPNPSTGTGDYTAVIDGVTQRFPNAAVRQLVVNAGAGNDSVAVNGYVENDTTNPADVATLLTGVTVNGGDGNDTVSVDLTDVLQSGAPAPLPVSVSGGAGDDRVDTGTDGPATLDGGDGNDYLLAETGTAVNNTATEYGDAGDDTLVASEGDGSITVHAFGGDGNDTFTSDDPAADLVAAGGAGTDTIELTSEGQTQGTLSLPADVEDVTGAAGSTQPLTIYGNASDNVIDVTDCGPLTVYGLGGNDTLGTSDPNADVAFPVTLDGGDGNDVLRPYPGVANDLIGGAGNDTADYSAYTVPVTVYLAGGRPIGPTANPTDTTDGSVESVNGGSGNDLLVGDSSNNVIVGNAGNDTLYANGGTDALFGGAGNDVIYAADGGPTYIDGGSNPTGTPADSDTAYTDPSLDTVHSVEHVNPAVAPPAQTITGTVFDDANGDAVQDGGERGLAGFGVYLDLNGNGTRDDNEPQAIADANGRYTFAVPGPATYAVRQVTPAGYQPTTAIFPVETTVGVGQTATVNIGERPVAPGTYLGSNGLLSVIGSANADTITVSLSDQPTGAVVTINGAVQTFTGSAVRAVFVNGGAGNDTLTLGGDLTDEPSTATPLPVTIDGGDGNDVIASMLSLAPGGNGLAPLVLSGDAGDDTITIDGGGDVTLDGGAGDDRFGTSGSNSGVLAAVYGGDGNDTLFADGDTQYAVYDGGIGSNTFDAQGDVGPVQTGTDYTGVDNAVALSGSFLTNVRTVVGNYFIHSITCDDLGDTVTYPDAEGADVTVTGGAGNDTISVADAEFASISGGGGNDLLTVIGGPGQDGAANNSTILGGDGNDTIHAADGKPTYIDGGAGTDTAYVDPTGDTTVYVETVIGAQPPTTTITGTVFNDANRNGKRDPGEAGVAGRTVFLDFNGNGKVDSGESTAVTNAAGVYTFSGLPQGVTWTVRQVVPAGFTATDPASGRYYVPLPAGTASGIDFGTYAATSTATITGTVFNDANHNGKQDAGEAGVAGRTVFLDFNGNGTVDPGETTAVTNAAGQYTFAGLPAGVTWTVRQVVPAGYTATDPSSGRYYVPLAAGQSATGINFGTYTATPTPTPTPTKLTGTLIGTAGSYAGQGNTAAKAVDGDPNTYFDAPTASGSWVGLALPAATEVSAIRYAPRPGDAKRMVGGQFQASISPDFSTGVVTVATITAAPAYGTLTTVALPDPGSYLYWRYIGPTNGFCDVAEFQLYA